MCWRRRGATRGSRCARSAKRRCQVSRCIGLGAVRTPVGTARRRVPALVQHCHARGAGRLIKTGSNFWQARRHGLPHRAITQRQIVHDSRRNVLMNPSGLARMRVVGKALAGLDPKTHNAMVAALSKRAAPYERWGPPEPVSRRARAHRCAADRRPGVVLVRAGDVVGGQCHPGDPDSTWNHVAMVVRGHMTFDEENDGRRTATTLQIIPTSRGSQSIGTGRRTISTSNREGDVRHAALLEASGEGVHIYPNIQDRLLSSQAYEEYTTVAVRALTGRSRGRRQKTRRN